MAKVSKAELPSMAEQIVQCLGGKENVARINHCATRLRFEFVPSVTVAAVPRAGVHAGIATEDPALSLPCHAFVESDIASLFFNRKV